MTDRPAGEGNNPILRSVVVPSTGYYYISQSKDAEAGPPPLLMGCHGYAQKAEDFLVLLAELVPSGFTVVAPQGSNQIWNPKTGEVTFSWMTAFRKEDNIRRNNRFLETILCSLVKEKTAHPNGIFLLGFSQGSSVVYRFARERPESVRGLISVCSDLPPDVEDDPVVFEKIPVLIVHSLDDPYVDAAKPEHAVSTLRSTGCQVEVLSFEEGHRIPRSLFSGIRDWIFRQLPEEFHFPRLHS